MQSRIFTHVSVVLILLGAFLCGFNPFAGLFLIVTVLIAALLLLAYRLMGR